MIKKTCTNENCIHNGVPQPIDNFHRNVGYCQGVKSECKDCSKVRAKKNNNKVSEARKEYFALFFGK